MPSTRVLVAIPAYNEEVTLAGVVGHVRHSLPGKDVLVVDDGSTDSTGEILDSLGVTQARHLCNLGYGRAIQTALKYAARHQCEVLVTLDADGQHDPGQLAGMLEEFLRSPWDLMIGSRYVHNRNYAGAPLGRRLGMTTFSLVVRLITGQRIYDTTSGLKMMKRCLFGPLSLWHFVDFHAEAIIYLSRLGYRVAEYPITVVPRHHGQSMYSLLSAVKYPLKTLMMVILGVVHATVTRRAGRV